MNNTFLIAVALFLFSCKKETIQYTFEGVITEYINHSPLQGVRVRAYQLPFNNSLISSNFELMAETNTLSDGSYHLNFDREKATEFKVDLQKSGYFDVTIPLSSSAVSSEDVNIVNYEMEAKSWLRFDLLNQSPSSSSDELKLIFYTYKKDCKQCIEKDFNYFYGEVDTTLKFVTAAGGYFKFTYSDVASGQSFTDSLYLHPFDTSSYSINY
ncbi:MAG: hypothetical protein WDZ35_14115 [Crocinitomicaceae bacterium]